MLNGSSLAVLMHGVTSHQWLTRLWNARDSVTVHIEGEAPDLAWGNVIYSAIDFAIFCMDCMGWRHDFLEDVSLCRHGFRFWRNCRIRNAARDSVVNSSASAHFYARDSVIGYTRLFCFTDTESMRTAPVDTEFLHEVTSCSNSPALLINPRFPQQGAAVSSLCYPWFPLHAVRPHVPVGE